MNFPPSFVSTEQFLAETYPRLQGRISRSQNRHDNSESSKNKRRGIVKNSTLPSCSSPLSLPPIPPDPPPHVPVPYPARLNVRADRTTSQDFQTRLEPLRKQRPVRRKLTKRKKAPVIQKDKTNLFGSSYWFLKHDLASYLCMLRRSNQNRNFGKKNIWRRYPKHVTSQQLLHRKIHTFVIRKQRR